jgi:hypothetical protein
MEECAMSVARESREKLTPKTRVLSFLNLSGVTELVTVFLLLALCEPCANIYLTANNKSLTY